MSVVSARAVHGGDLRWDDFVASWTGLAVVIAADFAPVEDEQEYEPQWRELGWGSASLGGAW